MAKKLERTFDVDATDVGIEDKGKGVPNWYKNGTSNYNNWWKGSDNTFYFYSVDGNTVYIQYGQNAEGWASTIFIVQEIDAKETNKGNNSIEVDGNVIVKMLDSVVTEYAGAGVQARTQVTLNGTTIKDKTGMTNKGSTLDGEKTVSIKETVDPQDTSDSTQLTMKNSYPNGEYPNSSVTLGLTLFNPNLPQYIPMAIRLGDKWQELDNGTLPKNDSNDNSGNDNSGNDKDKDKDKDNGNNDNGGSKDPNVSKNANLYNIKYENDNNINYIYDADGTDPNYPFDRPHLGVDLNFVNEELLSPVRGKAYYFNDPLPSSQGGTGYGNHVIIVSPDGHQYLFGHLDHALIDNGQQVSIGDKIAITDNTGDSTGPHLHFEVRKDSVASLSYGGTGYTIDPAIWREDVKNGKI